MGCIVKNKGLQRILVEGKEEAMGKFQSSYHMKIYHQEL